jgi:Zinc knuckle
LVLKNTYPRLRAYASRDKVLNSFGDLITEMQHAETLRNQDRRWKTEKSEISPDAVESVRALLDDFEKKMRENNRPQIRPALKNAYSDGGRPPQEGRAIVCFKCNKTGHIARECPDTHYQPNRGWKNDRPQQASLGWDESSQQQQQRPQREREHTLAHTLGMRRRRIFRALIICRRQTVCPNMQIIMRCTQMRLGLKI